MEKKNINQMGKKPYIIPTIKCVRMVHCRPLQNSDPPKSIKVEKDEAPTPQQSIYGYRLGW